MKDWQYTSDDRVWGKFYNLFQDSRIKVKELIIDSGKGISFQRHQKRSEVWFVSKGSCLVKHSSTEPENASDVALSTDDIFHVRQGDWHQLINPSEADCHVIEIQYGESTSEDDIERLFFYEGN